MPDVKPRPQNSSMKKSRGTMRRLRDSEAGNVAIMTAAAIVPLIALIGSAVDISRLYLTKTRLQQACDAGVLAARKSMVGNNWSEEDNGAIANEFFRANFPEGKYGTGSSSIEYSAPEPGVVTGTAAAAVPMTLMAFFNVTEQSVTATCTAELQLPNTDIMFVLDTTRSMKETNSGDGAPRIQVMRNAVSSFHETLEGMKPVGSRIRYGFVPYSSTVNVGMLLKPGWIVDKATYNSREPDGTVGTGGTYGPTMPDKIWHEISGKKEIITKEDKNSESCTAPADTYKESPSPPNWSAWSPSVSDVPRSRSYTRTISGSLYSAQLNGAGVCVRTEVRYSDWTHLITEWILPNPNHGKPIPGNSYFHWRYKPITYPMASLKGVTGTGTVAGGSFDAPVGDNHTSRTITWGGSNACIEERATRRTSDDESVPRLDMDINLVPIADEPDTQWKPYLPDLVYGRTVTEVTQDPEKIPWQFWGEPDTLTRDIDLFKTTNFYTPSQPKVADLYGACPGPSRKFEEITLSEVDKKALSDYLNSLHPAGNTYHDIGLTWGLRLMSPIGLFPSDNQAPDSGGGITRHLILLTDGDTDTKNGAYDAWGISAMDRRRTSPNKIPTDAEQNAITDERMAELCTYAKEQMNITVWVIAFGTVLTDKLKDCASLGRAFPANNAEELKNAFADIASQIASLRITR